MTRLGRIAFEAFRAAWRTPGIRWDHATFEKAWSAAAQAVVGAFIGTDQESTEMVAADERISQDELESRIFGGTVAVARGRVIEAARKWKQGIDGGRDLSEQQIWDAVEKLIAAEGGR